MNTYKVVYGKNTKERHQKVLLNPFDGKEAQVNERKAFSYQVKIYPLPPKSLLLSFFVHEIHLKKKKATYFVHALFSLECWLIFHGDFSKRELMGKWRQQRKSTWHLIWPGQHISMWLSASHLTSRCLSDGAVHEREATAHSFLPSFTHS